MSDSAPDLRAGPISTWTRPRRLAVRTGFVAVFLLYWFLVGLPTDTVQIVLWLWAATIAWNAGAPWRSHLRFARDWVWVAAVLVAYSFTRGLADNLGIGVHVTAPIRADQWLTRGELPTYWLQHHLCASTCTVDTPARWYDVIASFVYFSHFVTSLTLAMVLWLRSRDRWKAFMTRFLTLTLVGLIVYIAYPMAPPWWAAERGYLAEPIPRIVHRGWDLLGLHGAGQVIGAAEAQANPVAAMPSMHTAIASLVAWFGISQLRSRWRFVLVLYPLAMGATLIYLGEHYLLDVLAGYLCTALVIAALALGGRIRARHAERDTPISGEVQLGAEGHDAPPGPSVQAGPDGGDTAVVGPLPGGRRRD